MGESANSEGSKAKRMNIKAKTSSTVQPQPEKKKKTKSMKNNNEHSKNPPHQDRNVMTDANDDTLRLFAALRLCKVTLAESEGSKSERMNTKAKKSTFVQPQPVQASSRSRKKQVISTTYFQQGFDRRKRQTKKTQAKVLTAPSNTSSIADPLVLTTLAK